MEKIKSNIKLYYYDQNGLYLKSVPARLNEALTKKKGSEVPLVPENATTNLLGYRYGVPPVSWSSYDDSGRLKPAGERVSHKTSQFVFTDPIGKIGEWQEVYDLRGILFYQLDEDKCFSGEFFKVGPGDEPVNLPYEKPPSGLRRPKWENDQWIEGDVEGSIINSEGFILQTRWLSDWREDHSTNDGTGLSFVKVKPNSNLLKPKWNKDKRLFEEGLSLKELQNQKVNEVKALQRTLLAQLDEITTKYLEQKELVTMKKLTQTSISNKDYLHHLEQKQSIRQKGNNIEKTILSKKNLYELNSYHITLE
ncbi:MAG: hypothetical protein F6K39_14825 [Okeania sp. SIO3B3]|nr:hypothetical protein [Okeania sp. SIO3B3]